jgi:hypothetical protein
LRARYDALAGADTGSSFKGVKILADSAGVHSAPGAILLERFEGHAIQIAS